MKRLLSLMTAYLVSYVSIFCAILAVLVDRDIPLRNIGRELKFEIDEFKKYNKVIVKYHKVFFGGKK